MCVNISKCLIANKTNGGNFHPLEVVGRGSETHFNWIKIINIYFSASRVNMSTSM